MGERTYQVQRSNVWPGIQESKGLVSLESQYNEESKALAHLVASNIVPSNNGEEDVNILLIKIGCDFFGEI